MQQHKSTWLYFKSQKSFHPEKLLVYSKTFSLYRMSLAFLQFPGKCEQTLFLQTTALTNTIVCKPCRVTRKKYFKTLTEAILTRQSSSPAGASCKNHWLVWPCDQGEKQQKTPLPASGNCIRNLNNTGKSQS